MRVQIGSSKEALTLGQTLTIPILLPPPQEQQQIANYLTKKTSLLDKKITLLQSKIQHYQALKKSLINETVCRGLDKSVPLKDSGIEWIGKIPEHWEVRRFKSLFSMNKGLTITKANLKEKGILCVNYGEIHSKYGFELDTNKSILKCVDEKYIQSSPKSQINTGDFIFADTSEDIEGSGNFTYLKSIDKIFAGYHTIIAKPKISINSRFFAYIFDSDSFRSQIRTRVKGVKVYSITQAIIKETLAWIPNGIEQQQIANYLDQKTNKIDQIIQNLEAQIEQSKALRKSLINEVVTGQVKVLAMEE